MIWLGSPWRQKGKAHWYYTLRSVVLAVCISFVRNLPVSMSFRPKNGEVDSVELYKGLVHNIMFLKSWNLTKRKFIATHSSFGSHCCRATLVSSGEEVFWWQRARQNMNIIFIKVSRASLYQRMMFEKHLFRSWFSHPTKTIANAMHMCVYADPLNIVPCYMQNLSQDITRNLWELLKRTSLLQN